jgi:anti-sigma B factor antagonist
MQSFRVKKRQIDNDRQVGKVIILDISGKLRGCASSGLLRDAIAQPLEERHHQILLNLAKVSEIDSSCSEVLIEINVGLKKKGGQLKIVHLSQKLTDLMLLTKLLTIFDVYEDESQAIASFGPPSLDVASWPETYHALHPPSWGSLGMSVTFRAELMQHRSRPERSFNVKELLPNGYVTLYGIQGAFLETTFEPVRYAMQ